MTVFRLAHFSDTHVLSLAGAQPLEFLNKRATGAVNLAFNRARQYRVEIFEKLLLAVRALQPDHTICTGDLVNLALAAEFERVRGMLAGTFGPTELTVVPGNHDAYERDAERAARFATAFGTWLPHDLGPHMAGPHPFPVVRLLRGVAVIGLSTAIPTPAFLATGTVGEAQRQAAAQVLRDPGLGDRFRVVMLHHPLVPDPSRPLDLLRRLTDAPEVVALLQEGRTDLVVHGHNHVFLRNRLPGTDVPVIQVASGSRRRASHMAEFNVYRIAGGQEPAGGADAGGPEPGGANASGPSAEGAGSTSASAPPPGPPASSARLLAVERHIFDLERDTFVACDEWARPLP